MKFLEQIRRLERVHDLIRRKATGSPQQLANRLDVSIRTVYEIISTMKSLGGPIYYCHNRQSYCYEYPIRFHCDVLFEDRPMGRTSGTIFLKTQVDVPPNVSP
ncbi:MAG: HTH domain-containing protein [Bacteroidota bacterium]